MGLNDKKQETTTDNQETSIFNPFRKMWENSQRQTMVHRRCEMNVKWCTETNALVKLMMTALKSHGCEVDLSRHVACEKCTGEVTGGFDDSCNQVVVCSNIAKKSDDVCKVLVHELTHAFDKCRAKIDFTNIEHLACTEIRASNFSHCSLKSAIYSGEAKQWDYKEAHQVCVKNKAAKAVRIATRVPLETAMIAVDKVFDRCYNDLEPIGRIPRTESKDARLSLIEGELYGYSDSK